MVYCKMEIVYNYYITRKIKLRLMTVFWQNHIIIMVSLSQKISNFYLHIYKCLILIFALL